MPWAPEPTCLHVLLALSAVIITGLILAKGCALPGQLPVIGEAIVTALCWGRHSSERTLPPSFLPRTVAPFLGVIAQLGVLLYMFTVGLEFHTDLMRHRTHATVATSHASILVPFVLGALLALALYPRCRAVTCRLRASPSLWGGHVDHRLSCTGTHSDRPPHDQD